MMTCYCIGDNLRYAIESRDELPKPDILRFKIIAENDPRGNTKDNNSHDIFYLDNNPNMDLNLN